MLFALTYFEFPNLIHIHTTRVAKNFFLAQVDGKRLIFLLSTVDSIMWMDFTLGERPLVDDKHVGIWSHHIKCETHNELMR